MLAQNVMVARTLQHSFGLVVCTEVGTLQLLGWTTAVFGAFAMGQVHRRAPRDVGGDARALRGVRAVRVVESRSRVLSERPVHRQSPRIR